MPVNHYELKYLKGWVHLWPPMIKYLQWKLCSTCRDWGTSAKKQRQLGPTYSWCLCYYKNTWPSCSRWCSGWSESRILSVTMQENECLDADSIQSLVQSWKGKKKELYSSNNFMKSKSLVHTNCVYTGLKDYSFAQVNNNWFNHFKNSLTLIAP